MDLDLPIPEPPTRWHCYYTEMILRLGLCICQSIQLVLPAETDRLCLLWLSIRLGPLVRG